MQNKQKYLIYIVSMVISLLTLVACNKATKPTPTEETNQQVPGEPNQQVSIYSSEDLAKANPVKILSEEEIEGEDLNNGEMNIELPEPEEEEESDLETQAVLNGLIGFMAYYRTKGTTYQIWKYNQATNVKTQISNTTEEVQSVAITRDGNIVVASIKNANGFFDIYAFDNTGGPPTNLTNTNNKDEKDVSITKDGTKIVWSGPDNSGAIKVKICEYNATAKTCAISKLSRKKQSQASITANGRYILLIRELSNGKNRILIYDIINNTYKTVITKTKQLSHPSGNNEGTKVMYIEIRNGKQYIKIKDLKTNQITTELKSGTVNHTHISSDGRYYVYDIQAGSFKRVFSREVGTSQKAKAGIGNFNYEGAYLQTCPAAINIPDANLEAKIRAALSKPTGDISCTDMESLTFLKARNASITDLTGLEYATNLTNLTIYKSNISDISPIANLTSLTRLNLSENNISDISPVANLTDLTSLYLDGNNISDISPIANLTDLTNLSFGENNISDISPIANLTDLTGLFLDGNNISDISPIANLIDLVYLYLDGNNISDISPMPDLTRGAYELNFGSNSITDITPIQDLAYHRYLDGLEGFSVSRNCLKIDAVPNKGILAVFERKILDNFEGLYFFSHNNPKTGCPTVTQSSSVTNFDLPAATYDATEDWSFTGVAGDFTHYSTGGRFNGFIEAADRGSDDWYWLAPEQYHGDASDYSGGLLSYWIKQSNTNGPFVIDDIIMTGGGTTLTYRFDNSNPGNNWTYYAVNLREHGWKKGSSPASASDMANVLADLTSLKIRGDYYFGYLRINDKSGLDSVAIQRGYSRSPRIPPLAIPDNSPAGVSDSITITDTGSVRDLNVQLDITHTYMNDLIITLEHVATNTTVTLINRPRSASNLSCSGNNINNILSDNAILSANTNCSRSTTPAYLANTIYQSVGDLSDFNNENLTGEWKLTISDNAALDTGTLNSWSLFFK